MARSAQSEDSGSDRIERIIAPRRRSIGRDEVDRLLPFRARRQIGPFVYVDLLGPDSLPAGVGVDVPVHPHIGLATVTSLYSGSLIHRDSTGAVQRIEPGAVNWMTAGRGVAHSERSPDDERAEESLIAGLQTWVALPDEHEEDEPSFQHVPAGSLPTRTEGDVWVRLAAGTHDGLTAPTEVRSPMIHLTVSFDDGGSWSVPDEHVERAVLALQGSVEVDGVTLPPRHLAVLTRGAAVEITARGAARFVVLGGEPVGPREIRWNFVSRSSERIDRAAAAWNAGDWPAVPGDDERVPMPGASTRR